MFLEESLWIRDVLTDLNLHKGQTVVDLGSLNEEYHCLTQPYIDYHIFRPLRKNGVEIIHI